MNSMLTKLAQRGVQEGREQARLADFWKQRLKHFKPHHKEYRIILANIDRLENSAIQKIRDATIVKFLDENRVENVQELQSV
jgi:1,2-phenylacetyl-CoA epoxidase catalytic subunit